MDTRRHPYALRRSRSCCWRSRSPGLPRRGRGSVMDTLEFAAKLKAGGFTEQQAETQARALAEVVEKQLATKQDVDGHEANLRRDIEMLRADLKRDIELLRAELKKDIAETHRAIAETKAELIRWIVGVGILARLTKVI